MYEVINIDTDESHGFYRSLNEALGAVFYDRIHAYSIWNGDVRVANCEDYTDAENIYGLLTVEQSIRESRS